MAGIEINAQGDHISIGDVVGRDKIVNTIDVVIKNAYTVAEEAKARQEFEREILAQAVVTFSQRLRERADVPLDTGDPYKGLWEYRLGDSPLFFGRTRAIREMMERLLGRDARSRLTILHAESGAGKTSLIRAGLAPRLLAQGHLPLYVRAWRQVPTVALKQRLLRNLDRTPDLASAPLRDFLHRVASVLGGATTLFVFFDQFEEFFTQGLSREARAGFVAELGDCIDDDDLPGRFVLSLRDELFGQIGTFEPRIRHPYANQYLLLPFTRDEAREAIRKPAQRLGIDYEQGIVDTLLNDFQLETVAPPQLQLVCRALYQGLAPGERTITRALYDDQGGVAGILQGYLGQVLKRDLPPEHRQAAKSILSSLVTSTGQRDRKGRDELGRQLVRASVDTTLLDVVLNKLVDNHLLRRVRVGELKDQEEYELVHDYLIDEVKPWIDEDQKNATHIYDMLAQGRAQYRQYKLLLDANQIEIVKEQLHNPYLDLEADDCRFLLTSAIDKGADISPWMELGGAPVLDWIREIQREPSHPESLRLAAAATLGWLEDEETFAELETAALASPKPAQAHKVRALAHFLHHSPQKHHPPRGIWLWVEIQLAALQLRAGRQNISALSRVAGIAGAIGALIAVSSQAMTLFENPAILLLSLLFFPTAAFFLARLMGEVLARAQVILTRKHKGIQALTLAVLGSLVGVPAFLPLAFDWYGWAAGAVTGAALAWASQPVRRPRWMTNLVVPALAGVLTILACLGALTLAKALPDGTIQEAVVTPEDIPGLLAVGLLVVTFIRQAAILSSPASRQKPAPPSSTVQTTAL